MRGTFDGTGVYRGERRLRQSDAGLFMAKTSYLIFRKYVNTVSIENVAERWKIPGLPRFFGLIFGQNLLPLLSKFVVEIQCLPWYNENTSTEVLLWKVYMVFAESANIPCG